MSVILLLVAGLLSTFEPGDSCIDALHQLRTVERLDIESTEGLEDNVVVYTLVDSPRLPEKTAILICQRDVDPVDDGTGSGDDLPPDVIDPGDDSGAPGDPVIDGTEDDTTVE